VDTFKAAWQQEYIRKGIPSSFRTDPARVVVELVTWLKKRKIPLEGLAADIGCGLGRNSFYLASQGFRVKGIELLEGNVQAIQQAALKYKLPIQAFAQDAAESWPIEPGSLDIALDIFCYKHIVCKKRQAAYRSELFKTLKPSGFYFISLASDQDGFYGPLLKASTHPYEKAIVDPYSQIPSLLYSQDELIKEFSSLFDLVHIEEQRSISPMYEKEYSRVVINAIFRRKNTCPDSTK